LAEQRTDRSWDYEVVVVDNNSNDGTRKVVEGEQEKWGERLRYCFEPTPGKSYALNKGVREARGEILAFTDDDILIDKHWIWEMVNCFNDHHCDGVGGRVLPIYPDNTPKWIREEDPGRLPGIVVIYDYGAQTRKYEKPMEEFIGANYAFKREVFEACGLFREDFSKMKVPVGEDREFIRRIIKCGKLLYYCGQAVIHHPVDLNRATLKSIIRWNIALGRSEAQREREESIQFKYVFGIPRYLLKGVVLDLIKIFPGLFSRRKVFLHLRAFFRKIGMILEYRQLIGD
jgi:glycosyltransferase involved in cell wall biosynthesis